MFGIDASDWAIVFATFAGPVFAILAARRLDDRKLRRERQREVFDTLMLTRRATVSPDHVRVLNRIELEFANDREVMTAFRSYFDNLTERLADNADPATIEHFQSRRRRLFAELVKLIAKRQGFSLDRMDLIEGGYYPSGWQADEQLGRDNAMLLHQLLRGQRPMWIAVNQPSGSQGAGQDQPPQPSHGQPAPGIGPYPPPPTV